MKISTKLICGFMTVGLLLGLQSAASYQGFSQIKNKLLLCIENATLVDAAMEMKYAAARDMQIIMEILACQSLTQLDDFWTQHRTYAATFEQYTDAITQGSVLEGEKIYATQDPRIQQKVLGLAAMHREKFIPPLNQLYDLKKQQLKGKTIDQDALHAADRQADSVGEAIFTQLDSVEKEVKTVIDRGKAEALSSIVGATRILFSVTVAGLLLAALLGIVLSRTITRPITQTLHFTQAVADGDLSQQLVAHQKDEMGQMAGALNGMVAKLSAMLKEIIGNADRLQGSSRSMTSVSSQLSTTAGKTSTKSTHVAEAAEEMSNHAQAVAAAMEQSSSNISMVAASSEEMTATIKEIAQNAERARSVTEGAVQQSQRASDKMNTLGQAAHRISRVTETITEISEQTNLLALNATIEAARAGQAGRGFAVVANEIKELAHQTSQATIDIKNQIHEMQDITSTAVSDIEQITQVIDEISCVINGIAGAVEEQTAASSEIADNINQASQGMHAVYSNMQESSEQVRRISLEIGEINLESTQVGQNSQQVQTNAEELSTLAVSLHALVCQFKTDAQTSKIALLEKEGQGSLAPLNNFQPLGAAS